MLTVDDLKLYVNDTDGLDASLLEGTLAAAWEFTEGEVRRLLEPDPAADEDPVTKRVRIHGSRFVRVPDAREVTQVLIDDVEVTDYELHIPRKPGTTATHVEVFTRGQVALVTGRFGFDPLPQDLRDGILSLAARKMYEQSIGFADALQSTDWGGRVYTKRMPSPIAMVFGSYQVPDDTWGL